MIIIIVIIEEGRGDPIDESGGTEGKTGPRTTDNKY